MPSAPIAGLRFTRSSTRASSIRSGFRERIACWQAEWEIGIPGVESQGCCGPTQLAKWSSSPSAIVISATGVSSRLAASRVVRSNSSRASASSGDASDPVRTPCGVRDCGMRPTG